MGMDPLYGLYLAYIETDVRKCKDQLDQAGIYSNGMAGRLFTQ